MVALGFFVAFALHGHLSANHEHEQRNEMKHSSTAAPEITCVSRAVPPASAPPGTISLKLISFQPRFLVFSEHPCAQDHQQTQGLL